MTEVGDVLLGHECEGLPERAVVVHHDGDDYNVIIRTDEGFDWYTRGRGSQLMHHPRIYAGNWTVTYLPPTPPAKVGDLIGTENTADKLPVGTVMVDDGENDPAVAPAVKIDRCRWMYCDGDDDEPTTMSGRLVVHQPHRIIYLPPGADAGAGGTAA